MTSRAGLTLILATITARFTIWAVGAYAIWQGVWIVLGGPQRWTSPSFAVLRQAPHPTETWGTLLAGFGLLVLVGSLLHLWWLKTAGLTGIAIWSMLFAIGALAAVSRSETMATTGGPTYCLITFVAVVLIFIDERRKVPHA